MVLFLVVSQALAGDPPPAGSDTSGEAAEGEATPAPAEAPPPPPAPPADLPLFDVVVVKKGESSPPIAAPAAPTAAPATAATAPGPAPFDVTVVPPGPRLGGELTPPPLPAGTPVPPPPKEAPPGWAPGVAPAPISALPGMPPPPPVVSPRPPEPAPVSVPAVVAPPVVAPPVVAPPVVAPPVVAPPVVAPPVVAPAAPPPPPGVGLRLTKGESWRVKDAADLRYTTVQFARLVGDRETLRALDNAREFGKIGSTALAITGGGLLVASLVVVTSNVGQPSILDYSVDPKLYDEEADYEAAEDFAKDQYDKSIGEWQSQRLGSTLFLVGAGAVVLAGAPFVGRDNDKREQRPELVYTRERAQQWVDGYNAAHPPAAVAPGPTPAPEATAPAGEDPARPAAPPPPETAPQPTGGALDFDDEPDEPIRLELRPLVGVGFVGLSGRF